MPALTHLLDSDPHQTHALHGYMMDLGSSASHSLSTVKMPIPPTPTFYKLKWILHSAKWSTLKCMVGGHLVPSYLLYNHYLYLVLRSHHCSKGIHFAIQLSDSIPASPQSVTNADSFPCPWIYRYGSRHRAALDFLCPQALCVSICLNTHPLVHVQKPQVDGGMSFSITPPPYFLRQALIDPEVHNFW